MDSSLNISNTQDEENGPSASNKIESSIPIIPCETEPLDSEYITQAPITSDDMKNNTGSADALDESNDRSVSNEIESRPAITPFVIEPLNSDNVASAPIASDESNYRK